MTRRAWTWTWRKSSYSDAQGNGDCVEIAGTPPGISVRDSKSSARGTLRFGTAAWRAFIRTQCER